MLPVTVVWNAATWLVHLGREAVPAVAQLPGECRTAAAHAALVCVGASPTHFPPGCAPFSACWAWFLAGALCGVVGPLLLLVVGASWRPRPPWLTAAHEVLACASAGGTAELRALAAQAGLPTDELLLRLLHEAVGPRAPSPGARAAPRLPDAPRRRRAHRES